jgi:hypothetical protein
MEYFCNIDDALWSMDDEALRDIAASELEYLGLGKASEVVDFAVIRQPKAYPVYDAEYKDALEIVSGWLKTLENFQTVGRNGLHRYNNQDHSMLSAIYAAENILGGDHDVWERQRRTLLPRGVRRRQSNAGPAAGSRIERVSLLHEDDGSADACGGLDAEGRAFTDGAGAPPALTVSVVVPAHQAAGEIAACLRGIVAAGFRLSEILVVDDGSRDGTGEIARQMGVAVIRNDAPLRPAERAIAASRKRNRTSWSSSTPTSSSTRPPGRVSSNPSRAIQP